MSCSVLYTLFYLWSIVPPNKNPVRNPANLNLVLLQLRAVMLNQYQTFGRLQFGLPNEIPLQISPFAYTHAVVTRVHTYCSCVNVLVQKAIPAVLSLMLPKALPLFLIFLYFRVNEDVVRSEKLQLLPSLADLCHLFHLEHRNKAWNKINSKSCSNCTHSPTSVLGSTYTNASDSTGLKNSAAKRIHFSACNTS